MRAFVTCCLLSGLLAGCAAPGITERQINEAVDKRIQEEALLEQCRAAENAKAVEREFEEKRRAYVIASTASEEIKQAILRREVWINMSRADVFMALGKPISWSETTQILHGRVLQIAWVQYEKIIIHLTNDQVDFWERLPDNPTLKEKKAPPAFEPKIGPSI